ncbi:class I SAM-dependent methyltransferase [Myxococcota bacterium]|nr:class I SAM-dependent methyltransferase [Myxococcota bacterium]
MHETQATTPEPRGPKLDAPAILCHPRTKAPLTRVGARLVEAASGDAFEIVDGPIAQYRLFVDGGSAEPGRDPGQSWDLGTFEAGFERSGHYRDGVEYDRALGRDERLSRFHFERVKKRLLEWLPKDGDHRVLDVGCGAGYFLAMIHDEYRRRAHRAELWGMDVSLVQLRYMGQNLAQRGLGDAVAVHANAEQMPFADHSFDVVLCSEVLEHVRTPARALAEMRRVLKPSGTLLLSTPSRLNEELWDLALAPVVSAGKLIRRLGRKAERTGAVRGVDASYDVPWYPGELRQAFTTAHLAIERFEQTGLIPHPHYFDFVPRPLIGPTLALFEQLDRRWATKLPDWTAHLLVQARPGPAA